MRRRWVIPPDGCQVPGGEGAAAPGDRLAAAAARAAVGGVGRLPSGLGSGIGRAAGSLARLAGLRRDVARRQVAAAFPDRSAAWVRATVAGAYRHFGREAAAVARLFADPAADAGRRRAARETFREFYRRHVSPGQGSIIVTGHVGNWEMAGAVVAEAGVRATAVVKAQANPAVDGWLRERRQRLGIAQVDMHLAWRRLPEEVEAGRTALLVADQDAGGRGVVVSFLGRPASTHRGAAALARRTGAPLIFGALLREGSRYRAVVERVETADLPGEGADREITRRWIGLLEREVRRHPEQYLWFHRRWKSGASRRRNAPVEGR